jgi:hypothetical protein
MGAATPQADAARMRVEGPSALYGVEPGVAQLAAPQAERCPAGQLRHWARRCEGGPPRWVRYSQRMACPAPPARRSSVACPAPSAYFRQGVGPPLLLKTAGRAGERGVAAPLPLFLCLEQTATVPGLNTWVHQTWHPVYDHSAHRNEH